MRSLRSSKCLKTTVELTFTTQKANACLLHKKQVLGLLVLFSTGNTFFSVYLVQKLKIISLSGNFVPRLIQICRIPWSCSLSLFSTRNTFLGKFGPKNENCHFELKFNLINFNMQNYVENMWCSLFLF